MRVCSSVGRSASLIRKRSGVRVPPRLPNKESRTMNRLQELRDAIWTAGPDHFNMRDWVKTKTFKVGMTLREVFEYGVDPTSCGTVCCIAGHAAALMAARGVKFEPQEYESEYESEDIWDSDVEMIKSIESYFGLQYANNLFFARWHLVPYKDGNLHDHLVSKQPHLKECRFGAAYEADQSVVWETVLDYLDWLIKSDIEDAH